MAAIQGRLAFLKTRRVLALSLTLVVASFTWLLLEQAARTLGDPAVISGWTLLASTAGLYGLGLRKRRWAQSLSLGPVAAWLQVHTYLGIFALIVFCMHIGWPIRGYFEIALASMFLFISASGACLMWYSRRVPKLLSVVKRDYRYEDIPVLQAELAERAHATVLKSAETGAGATLAEFYQRRLLKFFHTPRGLLYRCLPTGAKRRQLLRDLEDLDRYLDVGGLVFRQTLSSLVIQKDDTDFHRAMQQRLRFMMAAHVAFTWALVLMIAVHIVLILRFQGTMV